MNKDVEEKGLLAEMRESRESTNAAYIEFTGYHKYFKTHVFCFFEGEDGKYYNQRIKDILGENIITIIPGNKRNTLKLWRKIKNDPSYSDVHKMFFVDKDMDDIPKDINEDLYITPCYSIENFYANQYTFNNILEAEFSINKAEKDYQKATAFFDKKFKEFCSEMVEFNALVLLRKEKDLNLGRVRINHIKTNNLIFLDFNETKKNSKYESTIQDLKMQLDVEESDVQNAIDRIKKANNYEINFRGKNQLDFLVKIVDLLKNANRDGEFFEIKRKTVSINLTSNRLSELSQYAFTPKSFKLFVQNHKIA